MKKSSKQSKRDRAISMKSVIIALVIIILVFPIFVNVLMYAPCFFTPSTLSAKEWLAFWGSYGGGVIGGVGAVLSVYFTLKYYREKDAEQQRLLQLTPRLERIHYLQKQVMERAIIKDESMLRMEMPLEIKGVIKEYNKLVPYLKGFFAEQAIGTLIGVFQLEDENGATFYEHSTLNYFRLPQEIREYAEIISCLSLYKNCTELLCNDSRLAYIIAVEGGGSAGMWPYLWHTSYLLNHDDIVKALNKLFVMEETLNIYFEEEYQNTYAKIYKYNVNEE